MKENKQAEEIWQEIMKIAIESRNLILKRIQESKLVDEKQNWLMFARVVNVIFQSTFEPALKFSEDKVEKVESEIKNEKKKSFNRV